LNPETFCCLFCISTNENFVKAMGKTGPANRYLTEKCPGTTDAKIKQIPQIHKLFRDKQLSGILRGNEKRVCNSLCLSATNFLGNNKAD
jgi:hypothetical protein